jgi:hypothetical protein
MSIPRLLFLISAAIMGCRSSSLEPFNLGQVYVLESTEGKPLPAEYAQNLDFHARMLADTLILGDDNKGEWRATVESDTPSGAPRHERSDLTYEQSGLHISISFVCNDTALASCIAPPHLVGTIGETGITITESRITRQPLVLRRAYPPVD